MKAKVINILSDYFDMIIDVKLLNYKFIFGLIPAKYEKVKVGFEDVEFIFEHEWEKDIIKYRDILNISIPGSASLKLYSALIYVLKEYYKGDINNISVLRDVNEKARRGYLYKRIEIVINDIHPACVSVSGEEYTDLYDINVEDMDINSIVYECKDGICKLKELIGASLEKVRLYEKILNNLEGPKDRRHLYKAIEGEVSPL